MRGYPWADLVQQGSRKLITVNDDGFKTVIGTDMGVQSYLVWMEARKVGDDNQGIFGFCGNSHAQCVPSSFEGHPALC